MNLSTIGRAIGRSIAEALDMIPALMGPSRGPELIGTPAGTGWTPSGTGASVTSGALVWSAANNLASNSLAIVTEDVATYEIIYTVSGYTGGGVKPLIYGATVGHVVIGTSKTANGTYTEQLVMGTGGSNSLRVMFQATGANGANTFQVTSVSVKKVLS